MPSVILFGSESEALTIQAAVQSTNARFKYTDSDQSAIEWISIQKPDVVIVGRHEIEESLVLADKIWEQGFKGILIASIDDQVNVCQLAIAGYLCVLKESLCPEVSRIVQQLNLKTVEREKILVVDDLDTPRDVICSYVERLGFHTIGASSAAEAYDYVIKNSGGILAVLSDINMPKVSGIGLIKQIRAAQGISKIPIIVLTAYGTGECLYDSLVAGASGFLVKPPKKIDLERELQRARRINCGFAPARLVADHDFDKLQRLLETLS